MNQININKKCDWGCGRQAIHYFPYSKKYCCGNNVSKCPEKNKKAVQTRKENNSYKTGSVKGIATKRTTMGISGKPIIKEAAIKAGKTKTMLDQDGNTIAKIAAKKMVRTRRNIIDPKTGLDLCKIVGKKQKETKDNTIDPITGLNMHKLIGQKSLATNMCKDKNGKTHFDRLRENVEWIDNLKNIGKKLAEDRRADIDIMGRDHYARRTIAMLENIDQSGLNAIERAQKKIRKASTRKRYKETHIHYQCSYELDFLEKLEKNYNFEWLTINVKNGIYIEYWNPVSNAFRHYIPDFIINNTLYEIKSRYTWNKNGKDINLEKINKAKLDAAIRIGFDVVLVLDKVEILWKD